MKAINKGLKLAEDTAKRIRLNNHVLAVYLFGSFATGRQMLSSDIDICVIGRLTERDKTEIACEGSEKVEVSFFDELPVYIKFEVLKEGKLLYCRDKRAMHDVISATLREYQGFHWFIEKIQMSHMAKT